MFSALVLAAVLPIGTAEPFRFVPYSEAKALGVTRASFEPKGFDATVETAVYEVLPPKHLLVTWRQMGSKILKRVRYDRESDAETFRRKCGFTAWLDGADGVLVPDGLSTGGQAALREAKKDVASCETLTELIKKCLERPDPIRMEGRRAMFRLSLMRPQEQDLDLMRLENLALCKRLSALLGEKTAFPPELKALPAGDKPQMALGDAAFPEMKMSFDTKRFKAPGNLGATIWSAPRPRSGKQGSLQIDFGGFHDRECGRKPYPGGTWKMKLWIVTEDGFLPYRWTLNFDNEGAEGQTPVHRPAAKFYEIERRFAGGSLARVVPEPVRGFSPTYPRVRLAVDPGRSVEKDGKWTWRMTLSIPWNRLRDFWPSVKAGRADVWYLELLGPGGKELRAKMLWPVPANAAEAEANRKAFEEGTDANADLARYRELVLGKSENKSRPVSVVEEWTNSAQETGCGLPRLAKPTHAKGEIESDADFYATVVKPLVERNLNDYDVFMRELEAARKEYLLK